jgi:hypothetical protein
MSQKIVIKVIDHKDQRYPTIGDWEFTNEDTLQINVSDLGDIKYNCLIAVHELIEALLCKFASPEITTAIVDAFDIEYEKQRKENDDSEPGDSSEAPYHEQHKIATVIEMLVAIALNVSWAEYEKRINEL